MMPHKRTRGPETRGISAPAGPDQRVFPPRGHSEPGYFCTGGTGLRVHGTDPSAERKQRRGTSHPGEAPESVPRIANPKGTY
jgi:hypothetical protein